MRWPFRRPDPIREPRLPHARPITLEREPAFSCTTCGRTDLPETGGWNPPICEECDAAISFDQEVEVLEEGDR